MRIEGSNLSRPEGTEKINPENIINSDLLEARAKLERDKIWAEIIDCLGLAVLALAAAAGATNIIEYSQTGETDRGLATVSGLLTLLGSSVSYYGRAEFKEILAKIQNLKG